MMGPIIKGYATSQQIIIYFWSLEANSYTGSHFMYRIISAQEEQGSRLWSKGLVCLSLKFCFGSEVILCLLRHFLIRLCTKISYGFQIPSKMSNSTLTQSRIRKVLLDSLENIMETRRRLTTMLLLKILKFAHIFLYAHRNQP